MPFILFLDVCFFDAVEIWPVFVKLSKELSLLGTCLPSNRLLGKAKEQGDAFLGLLFG